MGFLDKLRDRLNYTDAPIIRDNRGRRNADGGEWLQQGMDAAYPQVRHGQFPVNEAGRSDIGGRLSRMTGLGQSRGVIDRVGGGGNADGSPNVVYDPGPEQFEKNLKLQQRLADIEEMKAQGTLENARIANQARMTTAGASAERAAVARYRAEHPNAIFKETSDGIVAIDPQTNEVTSLGVSGLRMPEEEAIKLRTQGAMDVQGMRNEGALAVTGARDKSAMERLLESNAFNRANTIYREDANTFRTGMRNDMSPVERAMQIFNTDPAMRKFIQMDETGKNFVLKQPGAMIRGTFGGQSPDPDAPTQEQFEVLKSLIYPSGQTGQMPVFPEVNKPAINSLGSTPDTVASPVGNIQLKPNQYSSFNAKPGQFEATPGQFTAGTTDAAVAAKGLNPQELRTQAAEFLKSNGKAVTEESIERAMQMLLQQQGQGGATGGTPQGTPQAGAAPSRYGTVTPLGTPLKF